jgi:hypothetical protein
MKTNAGSGGIALRILDLCKRWRWAVSFTPQPLYPRGKSPRYPLDRRLGGPQSRSGHSGKETNLTLPGIEPRASDPAGGNYADWAIPTPSLRFSIPKLNALVWRLFRWSVCPLWEVKLNHDWRSNVVFEGGSEPWQSLLKIAGQDPHWYRCSYNSSNPSAQP